MIFYKIFTVSVPAYLWKSGYCVTSCGSLVMTGCHSPLQQGRIRPLYIKEKEHFLEAFFINFKSCANRKI